jgi:GDPmannose 4,6-dehydratase
MSMKKALITRATGQDGSYWEELLVAKGYRVHGIVRRVALEYPTRGLGRVAHLHERLQLHAAPHETIPSVYNVFRKLCPQECHHLAAPGMINQGDNCVAHLG